MSLKSKLIKYSVRITKSLQFRTLKLLNMTRSLKKQRLRGSYRFIGRSNQSSSMVMIVCGYKPELWDIVFERILLFIPRGIDICLVCPGFNAQNRLEEVALKNKWSILLCKENKIGIAQNHAIKNHLAAKWIHKLDEDIFITKEYFQKMQHLQEAITDSAIQTGFFTPLLNVNGYSSTLLLQKTNLLDGFESHFGEANQACMDTPIWINPLAARYIWENSGPLDALAEKLYNKGNTYTFCPHRFSIGAILFHRDIWDEIDYFTDCPEKQLGYEEVQLCNYCFDNGLKIVVSDEILVGHFSFSTQTQQMFECYSKSPELFTVKVS